MVVEQTPVKEGFARGGWRFSFGSPVSGTTGRKDPDGQATVFEEVSRLKGVSPFATIFLGNTVPYIDDLENGTSRQAPDGILRVVVPAWRAMNVDLI